MGGMGYNGGVNLFKVPCTHVWYYHNETPVLLMYANSKRKLKNLKINQRVTNILKPFNLTKF
jgi:hypothetical protein